MNDKKKIGLFFGSFNPIHIGHLAIGNYAVTFGDFDEIWLVVSPHNPLKSKDLLIDEKHRLAMAELAVKSLDLPVKICDIEMRLPKPSYTINTLQTLEKENNNCEFCVIMGADSLNDIELWKDYQKILENYKIYVYPRLGYDAKLLCDKYKTLLLSAPIIEISSTFIRENISKGKNMNAFVAPEVNKYIKENKLYESK